MKPSISLMNYLEKMMLKPDLYLLNLSEVNLLALKAQGIKMILIDGDNTLFDLNSTTISEANELFLNEAKALAIEVVLFSNNFSYKVEPVAIKYDLTYYSFALKPFPYAYWKCLRAYALKPREVVVVGDQLFTDILGAKLSGLRSIMTQEIYHDRFSTKLLRPLERLFLDE